jgi:flagellar biosynthesis protein FlhF
MGLVRTELGDDAVIISTIEDDDGRVRVTAALERDDSELDRLGEDDAADSVMVAAVARALDYHGVPAALAERLLSTVRAVEASDPGIALGAALDETFRFAPLPSRDIARPVMLVGPHGAGKTLTVAKLAARLVMQGLSADVICADTTRAGAAAELAAFTDILGITLREAARPEALADHVSACVGGNAIFIDSPGVNPFDAGALADLGGLATAADADPVLVLPAGIDPIEAGDIAEAFRVLAPSRLVTTRIDAARRLGGMLVAADAGALKFADAGITGHVAHGLAALNPVSLARLLNRDPSRPMEDTDMTEAAE